MKEKDVEKKNNDATSDTVISDTPSDEKLRRRLNKSQKIQLLIALLFTFVIILLAPAVAWFSHQKEMAVSTKVNSPATLEIKSGGRPGEEQDIVNFELSDIDTENKSYSTYTENGTTYYYKDFVFCVKGKAISSYDLQIAHTTNIAFKYQLYRAIQDDANGTIQYISKDKSVTQYYRLATVKLDGSGNVVTQGDAVVYENNTTPVDGRYINNANPDGRILADNTLTSRSYDSSDTYQVYANPVYWIKRGIPVYTEEKTDEGFTHSYVLRISWVMKNDNSSSADDLDVVQNNKETDMIYITAAVH